MTACERCDGQGEVFDRKDFWGNDLTVQCPECNGEGHICSLADGLTRALHGGLGRVK